MTCKKVFFKYRAWTKYNFIKHLVKLFSLGMSSFHFDLRLAIQIFFMVTYCIMCTKFKGVFIHIC